MKIISKRKLTFHLFEDLVNNEVLINYYGSLNFELASYLIENLVNPFIFHQVKKRLLKYRKNGNKKNLKTFRNNLQQVCH